MLSEEEIVKKIESLSQKPLVIQALWDGDTSGWILFIEAVLKKNNAFAKTTLAFLRGNGGDLRLFNAEVPPWPEAETAKKVGKYIEEKLGIPFFFPSPEWPDDNCPNWWEQDKAVNCKTCRKLIIPTDSPYLPKDQCYHCYLKLEKFKK